MIHGIDPTRVKAAVFDLGGVFLAGGLDSLVSFGQRHGLTTASWSAIREELFSNDGIWAEMERGERPLDDFVTHLSRIINQTGGQVSIDQARNFMQTDDPDGAGNRLRREIVGAARRIHARMPTALLTNNIAEWRPIWRSTFDVDEVFDIVVDSSEVGTRKPEQKIYEITRERLGLRHEDLFFLDDQGPNLKVARALGWQTFKYEDTGTVLEVLEALAGAVANDLRPRGSGVSS